MHSDGVSHGRSRASDRNGVQLQLAASAVATPAQSRKADGPWRPPRPIPRLTQSPRLQTIATLADAHVRVGFHLAVDADVLGHAATVRLLDGMLDALESHFEGDCIHLVIACPVQQIESLSSAVIRVPRLDLWFAEPTSLAERDPALAALAGGPDETRALERLMQAAISDFELTLTLPLSAYPLRPFSARGLAECCARLSWQERRAPLARRRREAPLPGPALFARELAVGALERLHVAAAALAALDPVDRRTRVLAEIASAELGFWAPEPRQEQPPLILRTPVDEIAWPWKVQPWKTETEPLFLWLEDFGAERCEDVLRLVYDTLHR